MVAHHAVGGCPLLPGDLFGTGTISAPGAGGLGSLLEQTQGGKVPVQVGGGQARTYLADGDEVILRASCAARPGVAGLGFGECRGVVAACGTGQEE